MRPFVTNRVDRAKFLRQRKFFLFLPALVLPSVTVLFYLLGGGSNRANAEEAKNNKGLNTSLPNANIKKENSWNKMQYYQQAEQDSVKRNESVKNETGYTFSNSGKQPASKTDSAGKSGRSVKYSSASLPSTSLPIGHREPNEEAVIAPACPNR